MSEDSKESEKRGNRLYPPRSSRVYWVLTELRRGYEKLADQDFTDGCNRLVDYGCGNMPYRTLFEETGVAYLGFDFAGNDMSDGRLTDDGRLPVGDAETDFVLSSQVLEHVANPSLYLSEALRVLKPGGHLLLSTHGVWKYHPDPTDFWRWTGDGLRKLISEHGFEVQSFEGIVGPAAVGIQIFQDAWAGNVPQRFRGSFVQLCQRAMQYCDIRCAPELKANDACVFLVDAIKRA